MTFEECRDNLLTSAASAYDQKVRHEAMNDMLRMVVTSLKEYLNGGGDIQVMAEVDRLRSEMREEVLKEKYE